MFKTLKKVQFPITGSWGTEFNDVLAWMVKMGWQIAVYNTDFIIEVRIQDKMLIDKISDIWGPDVWSANQVYSLTTLHGHGFPTLTGCLVEPDTIYITGPISYREFQLFLEILYQIKPFQYAQGFDLVAYGDDLQLVEPGDEEARWEWRMNRMQALRNELEALQREEAKAHRHDLDEVSAEAIKLLKVNAKNAAIKYVREKLGYSLSESNDFVENLIRQQKK